jgi:hypothetical protein
LPCRHGGLIAKVLFVVGLVVFLVLLVSGRHTDGLIPPPRTTGALGSAFLRLVYVR